MMCGGGAVCGAVRCAVVGGVVFVVCVVCLRGVWCPVDVVRLRMMYFLFSSSLMASFENYLL